MWMREGAGGPEWDETRFIPLFVMRKEEASERKYYYLGHVNAIGDPSAETTPQSGDQAARKVTVTNLHLAQALDRQLYRHLTGAESA